VKSATPNLPFDAFINGINAKALTRPRTFHFAMVVSGTPMTLATARVVSHFSVIAFIMFWASSNISVQDVTSLLTR
jgi:hypothetical protein